MTTAGGTRDVRRDLLLLIAFSAVLYLPALGARDLWNPNEPLYGRAVVEMARASEWLLPTVNGEVFDEKPILYFWLARVAALVTGGVDAFALRLPSALAGIGATLGLYALVRRSTGALRARIAGLLFATTYSVFWSARMVQMDLLLTLSVLGTVACLYRPPGRLSERPRAWAAAGVCAGLGVLAKGPLGVVLPSLVLFCRRPADAFGIFRRGRAAWFALAAVAVAAPWFLWLAAGDRADALGEFFVRHHLQRFVESWDHDRPWWYYVVNMPPDMAPWSLWLPLCVALPLRDRKAIALDRLAWVWLLAPLVFFSLSAGKRSIYLLPTAPAVAILVSGYVERFVRGHLDPWRDRIGRALAGLLAAILAGAGWVVLARVADYPAVGAAGRGSGVLMLASAAVIAATLLAHARHRALVALTPLLAVAAIYVQVAVQVLPRVDAYKSGRGFGEAVRAVVPDEAPLRSYRFWKWRASYLYYIDREIPGIDGPTELQRFLDRDETVFVLVEREMLPEVRRLVPGSHVWVGAEIGSNAVHLVSNHEPPNARPPR